MKGKILPIAAASAVLAGVLACDKAPNPVSPAGTVLVISASPTSIALSGQGSTVTITGTRPDGNRIQAGTQVNFTTTRGVLRPAGGDCSSTATVNLVEADNRGQASVLLCGDGRAGDATVKAALVSSGSGGGDGATTGTAELVVSIGTQLTMSASLNNIALSGQASTVTATGSAGGNRIGAGTQIQFTTTRGVLRPAGGSCSSNNVASIVVTNNQGQSSVLLCGDGRPGDATVTATLVGSGGGGDGGGAVSADVMVSIGAPTDSRPVLIMSANPSTIVTTETATVTMIARASDGSALGSGERIRLTSDLGALTCSGFTCPGESASPCSSVCTNSRGEAEAVFTAGTRSGTGKVRGVLGTSDQVSVDIAISAAINSLDLTANPQAIDRLDAGAAIILQATALDAQGSPLTGILVRFEAPRGTLTATTQTTNSQGVAQVTLTVRTGDAIGIPPGGTFRVTATATAEGQTRSDTVDIVVR